MDLLVTIVELSHQFRPADYVRGGGGNTSAKDAGTLWVKPSGTTLSQLKPEDFVALDRNKLARLYSTPTTANPTLYRAGLAFQAIMPKFSRFRVTLVIGLIATTTGMFPAVVMRLLDFVAMWGMILMPMGAVIFVDFWLMRKFGLKSNYAELSGKVFNWAAGLAWFVTMGVCWWLVYTGRVEIYFVSLPGWFVTAVLYVVFSAIYQSRVHETPALRAAAKTIGWLSLAALILTAILYLAGAMNIGSAQRWMLILTAVWFVSAALWMWERK